MVVKYDHCEMVKNPFTQIKISSGSNNAKKLISTSKNTNLQKAKHPPVAPFLHSNTYKSVQDKI